MDWADSPQQAEFRAKVRRFFEDNLPQRYREDVGPVRPHTIRASNGEEILTTHADWGVDRYSEDPAVKGAADDWAKAMAAEGYIASSWPQELGGAGFTTLEQFIFNEERERANAPRVGGTGAMFLGSLLMVYGSEEQRAKWMPPIAAGQIDWAQGYSEPGSGSDLASLQCRAVRDGDEYVINGQKLWSQPLTSDAMYTLVRTDHEAPKHKGISFLMIEDLNDPGITMAQLPSMAFAYPGNGETFFHDVRVPAGNLIGEENQGWYVAMTLMDFDRGSLSDTGEDRRSLAQLVDFVQTDEGKQVSRVADLPTVRAEIADRVVEASVWQSLAQRVASMQAAGLIPNYEASIGKCFSTELHQRRWRTGTRAFGLYANLWPGDERAPLHGEFTYEYAQTVAYTIYGGSSEIQRNVIATRGLGLPRG